MKKNSTKYSLLIIVACSISFFAITQPPANTPPAFESAEVHKDNKITFRYFSVNAKEVKVSTQLASGTQPMTKGENGIWSVTLGPVKPDMYPYCFLVDGIQVADPRNTSIFPNEGFQNSIVEITGSTPLVHTVQNVPHGTLSYRYYYSPELGTRPVLIYTPPGYEADTKTKYPVLYLLHGTTDTEETWAKVGRANIILDNLIAAGKAMPMLIVMPDANIGTGGFSAGGIESSLKLFEREMKEAIIPIVEKNYRTLNDGKSRAMAGLSLGGLHTLYTGINNTDKFSYLGVFSSGWIVPMMNDLSDKQYAFLKDNATLVSNNLKLLWISEGGKEDIAWKNGQTMLGKFDEVKIKYTYSEYPGGHTWPVWRNNLYNFAQLLFK